MILSHPRTLILIASSLLSMVLGSVHAFSVFLEPLELLFGASRTMASITYSLALAALTLAVLVGHTVFGKLPSWLFVAFVCLVAALGTVIAASATALWVVWLGYSLLFGAANGFGYAFGLQMSAQASPGQEGVAMGIITAFYALGAMTSPALFSWAIEVGGFQLAMWYLASTLAIIAPLCAAMFARAKAQFVSPTESSITHKTPIRPIILLWIGYGAGVAAGLMAIGHATGIAKSTGLSQSLWIAPFIIAIFNMVGSLAAGWIVDRSKPGIILVGLAALSSVTLFLLATTGNTSLTLVGLGMVGLTYGALIAAYPASVSKMFGVVEGTKIYGRIFTAWGTAGLFAPWFAGLLFDYNQNYTTALVTAAGLGVISAIAIIFLYRKGSSETE